MWYSKVTASLGNIPDFIQHYDRELDEAKKECRIGGVVETTVAQRPANGLDRCFPGDYLH